jgi:type IV pilus assembly protein PilO
MALDLNEKPWWVAFLIGLVLGVVAFVAANAYIFKDIKREIARIEKNIDSLEREIEKGRAAQRDLPRLEEEIRNFELELDRLRRILPTKRETDGLIKRLKQLTERGNFRLTRFTPMPFETRDFFQVWPLKVQLDGTYHELGLLFDRLSRFSRIINVSELKITPMRSTSGSNPFTIQGAFTMVTFIYIEDEEEETGQ